MHVKKSEIVSTYYLLCKSSQIEIFNPFLASNIEQVMEAAPHKAAAVQPPTTHHKNYQS